MNNDTTPFPTRSTLWSRLLLAAALLCALPACVHPEEVNYIQNIPLNEQMSIPQSYQIVIKKDDRLFITVSSKNPTLAEMFNKDSSSTSSPRDDERGYFVNTDGDIVFPVLGRIKAAGKTCSQLATDIEQEIIKEGYIKDPAVSLRLMNFKFSVLGEVTKPGSYEIKGERLTLLEALSKAGDLNMDGNRDIYIIRENDGKRIASKIDLRDSNLFQSPYYYIQQNDVIYVTPSDRKINTRSEQLQMYPYLISGTSIALVIIAFCV